MILDTIVTATKKRVEEAKGSNPLAAMKQKAEAMPKCDFRFARALRGEDLSFICEVKKASPSKGLISADFPYLDIARDYAAGGAAAISVLTEPDFFQGSNQYLSEIKEAVDIPLLRKDFIIDEYQIYEAKVIGADAVLLICAILDTDTIGRYREICDCLGLCALVEAHNVREVEGALASGARIIGVNNRDLRTFNVDIHTCVNLRLLVPPDIIFIAESGIRTPEDIDILRRVGVDAVLIGEALMKSGDRQAALRQLKGGGA